MARGGLFQNLRSKNVKNEPWNSKQADGLLNQIGRRGGLVVVLFLVGFEHEVEHIGLRIILGGHICRRLTAILTGRKARGAYLKPTTVAEKYKIA